MDECSLEPIAGLAALSVTSGDSVSSAIEFRQNTRNTLISFSSSKRLEIQELAPVGKVPHVRLGRCAEDLAINEPPEYSSINTDELWEQPSIAELPANERGSLDSGQISHYFNERRSQECIEPSQLKSPSSALSDQDSNRSLMSRSSSGFSSATTLTQSSSTCTRHRPVSQDLPEVYSVADPQLTVSSVLWRRPSQDLPEVRRCSPPPDSYPIPVLDPQDSSIQAVNLRGIAKFSLDSSLLKATPCTFFVSATRDHVRLHVKSKASSAKYADKRSSSDSSFVHTFTSYERPLPHLLHPDIEGPSVELNAPYTITFKVPQIVLFAEEANHRGVSSLTYIFQEPSDRIRICECLTKKRLLAHIGCNRINYGGQQVAAMCALALWCDEICATYIISFFPNLTKSRSSPLAEMQLIVLGLWQAREAERKNAKSLSIATLEHDIKGDTQRDGRRPSVASTSSSSTSNSSRSSGSGVSARRKCGIEFTRPEDRRLLLDFIKY